MFKTYFYIFSGPTAAVGDLQDKNANLRFNMDVERKAVYQWIMNKLLEGPKEELLHLIKRRGGVTLHVAMKAVPLAKATLRQHLLKLEEKNLVSRRYDNTKGLGRPEVVFELTSHGESYFPSKNSSLFTDLLEFLKESGQQSTIDSFLKSYWKRRRRDFQKYLEETRRQQPRERESLLRLEALKRLLEEEGFMPETKVNASRGIEVKECHCPFADVLSASLAPCKLESEFISWALKTPMERKTYIPKGDRSCSYAQKRRLG